MITFKKIEADKKQYMDLLWEADPSEKMIDRYLEEGDLYVAEDDGSAVCVAVVLPVSNRECELKNLAVAPMLHAKGYGRQMVQYLLGLQGKVCGNERRHCGYRNRMQGIL